MTIFLKRLLVAHFFALCLCKMLSAQCFLPADGSTIVINCDPAITDFAPALSGLTFVGSETMAGSWVIDNTMPAGIASFAPDPNNMLNLLNEGFGASLSITDPGTITLTNTIFDIANPMDPNPTTCTHSYTVACYSSSITDNQDYVSDCPTNILVMIDESGSVADEQNPAFEGEMEAAVMALANGLIDTEVSMAILEFESKSRAVPLTGGSTAFLPVDATLVSDINAYLSGNVNTLPNIGSGATDADPRDPNSYTPGEDASIFVGGTNWEDALVQANGYGADMIIMITDGVPTYYNDGTGVAGAGDELDMTALQKAQDAANAIKSGRTHLYILGVGPESVTQPLIEISGADSYDLGDTLPQFCAGDFSKTEFPDLLPCLEDVAAQIVAKQNCVVEPEPIPTMGEWGLICLSLLFMIFGVCTIKQNAVDRERSL